MVAYSFKAQFVPAIEEGRKRHTIRAVGKKRHARPGEAVQLYTAQRTIHCRKLGVAICAAALPIRLEFGRRTRVMIQGRPHLSSSHALNGFAQRDGFEDWFALQDYWAREHGATSAFDGLLIEWRDLELIRCL